VADIMLETMDADVALLNAGTLRSDALHPIGSFKLKDLTAILPMIDLITVLDISGKNIMYLLHFFKIHVSTHRLSFNDDIVSCGSYVISLCFIA